MDELERIEEEEIIDVESLIGENVDLRDKVDILIFEVGRLRGELAERENNFVRMLIAIVKASGGEIAVPESVWRTISPKTTLIRIEDQDSKNIIYKIQSGLPEEEEEDNAEYTDVEVQAEDIRGDSGTAGGNGDTSEQS